MGYVERELNNPSQKRSGLASAALRRLSPKQNADQQNRAGTLGDPNSMQKPINTRTATGRPSPVGGGISGGGSGIGNQGIGQTGPPRLEVSNIGKLKPQLGSASMGATDLPFDAEAADAQQSLQAQRNKFEADATGEEQRIEREYVNQRRGVEDEIPEQQRRLLENYSGRGLAYSSGYAYDQGDQKAQYARLLGDLEAGKTDGIADLLRQRGQFNDEWGGRLQSIQQAAARRLALQAGDLGLGGEVPGSNEAVMDDLFGGGGGGQEFQPEPAPQPQQQFDSQPAAQLPYVAPSMAQPQQAPVQQAPQLALNNPGAAPGITNPYYNPQTQVQTPNMIDGGDPGMRGGQTIAQIAAASAPRLSAGTPNYMGMTPQQVAAAQAQQAPAPAPTGIDPNILKLLMSGSLTR